MTENAYTREADLVRAELVDTLRDYAEVFLNKSEMEQHRAKIWQDAASRIEHGEAAGWPTPEEGETYAKAYRRLELRHEELKLRMQRLLEESGL